MTDYASSFLTAERATLVDYVPSHAFYAADPDAPTPSVVLRAAQQQLLAAPRRPHSLLAHSLFWTMDLAYGRRGSVSKFVVLELVARVPYQAWENVGYVAITHSAAFPRFSRRIFEFVRTARAQQDNEQWHLLIMQELAASQGQGRSWLRFRALPQLLALFYYHVSWLLYVLAPRLSYALNADFEDHAMRTYLTYVQDHPELDQQPWVSDLTRDYGEYATVGDVLRRIALDEQAHRDESLERMVAPRFH